MTHPTSLTVTQGHDALLTAVLTGTEPFSYQWRRGEFPLPAGTNLTLTLTNVAAAQAGLYDLIVTNSEGSVTSQVAMLTVLWPTDLAVDQRYYDDPVSVGSTLNYSIQVTNRGPSVAADVTLTDILPSSVTFVSAVAGQGSCGMTNGVVTCALGTLAVDAAVMLTITVVPGSEGFLTNAVQVAGLMEDTQPDNNASELLGEALAPPQIVTPPAKRSVLEGTSHQFNVTATGSVPLHFQWSKGGLPLANATNTSLLLTGITTNDVGDYTVTITNLVGSVTSAVARLTVRRLTDPVYPAPQGGWAYRYTGDAASSSQAASLDGTWVRPSTLDAWAGDTRGAGNGLIGGISISNGVMTMEDAQATTASGFNNRRYYFTHDLSQETAVTNAGTLLNDGVTLTFRARLTPPTDPWIELTNAPNGWVNNSDGKGIFGLRQSGAGGMLVGFSLNNALEDTGTSSSFNFGQAGLHMNNLNGNTSSTFVDPGEGGTLSLLPLDPTAFHEFWVTIQDNGGAPGTHVVSIYLDGALSASSFNITAGNPGPDGTATNYLALGLGSSAHRGAVDIDFFGYRPGIAVPAGFNQLPGITSQPQSQFVSIGGSATFQVGVTGTPPFAVQWYLNGAPVPGATNFSHTTGAIGTNDQFAAYTVVVTNDCGAVTSGPPALVLLLAPPLITAQPADTIVTNGDPASLSVTVNSATTPSYQWRFGGASIPGATSAALSLGSVSPAQAGAYDVVIQNSSGSVTSTVANLVVRIEDWGDAPAGYATLKAQNGARHLLVAGVRLGALIDGETNGQPAIAANGDDLAASADEDGVHFVNGLFVGQVATVDVVASTNGFVSVWLDLNIDGDWAEAGESVVTNALVVPGTNRLAFPVPLTAAFGNSYARVRFSTLGELTFDGPAADGEVEDFLVTIGGVADVGIHAVQSPAAATLQSPVSYALILTNAGPSSGGNVVLSNTLPAGATFVSALPSQGGCSHSGGVVVCALGLLPPSRVASVTVTVSPTAVGSMTNRFALAAVQFDPVLSDNTIIVITPVAVPPTISAQPANVTTTNGMGASFTVTASGTSPLAYQWRHAGTNIPGATNASLVFGTVTADQAGSYTVLVTNIAGSVVSDAALLTVLVPPQILTQPQSRTNAAGSTAVFQVQASGTAPLAYQWFFQGTNALPGQTASILSLPVVQLTAAGPYTVVVSNLLGLVASAPATLTVIPMDFGDAAGAGFRTLSAEDGARHRLVAGLRLGAAIDFEADGQPDAAAMGDDLAGGDDEDGVMPPSPVRGGLTNAFQVVVSTNGLLHAWIDFDRDGTWTNADEHVLANRALVPGTNIVTVTVPSTLQAGQAAARFRFTTASNLAFYGEAPDGEVEDYQLTLVAEADLAVAGVITPNPLAVGGTLTWTVNATNPGPARAESVFVTNTMAAGVEFVAAVSTQGSCSASPGSIVCQLGALPGAGSATIEITAIPTSSGNLTNVSRITSAATELNSANNVSLAILSALEVPVISVPPQNQTVTNGGLAQFSVTATGTQLQYQWRLAATNLPGATNATLSIANAQPANAGAYTVLVSNAVGSVVSAPATLTVLVPLTITTQPSSQTVVKGATVTLNAAVTGSGPLSYQWEQNGVDLPEGNVLPLVLTNIQTAQAGSYRVRITNPIGTVISANAIINVLEPPVFTVQPLSSTNLVGTSVQLTAQAQGTAPIFYNWFFNRTTPLIGQSGTSLSLSNLQLSQSGNYTLVATNSAGFGTSQMALVLVIEADFGDAPEQLGYSTTLIFDGARHRILPGVRLGATIDRESDGQPTIGATGDNLAGADEDGVIFSGALLRGYSSPIQIIASTNGFIDGWVDFNVNGTWVDPGEKTLSSYPVVPGTNLVLMPIAPTAAPGTTYARFRFSTSGGLLSTGYAPDGEVEDYVVTIQQAADLGVTMTDAPDPVTVQSNLVYTMTVTNNGPAAAASVNLTNFLPSSVTFVSVTTTAGSCSQNSGVVRCSLGSFPNAVAATVNVTVRPNAAGTLSNHVMIVTGTAEGAFANNSASQLTKVFIPAVGFSNTTAIPIADATAGGPGKGNPYPSTINVSGLTGAVHKVTVTLFDLTHLFADDLDILLVGPGGESVFLMSDAGGDATLDAVDLTLDDGADIVLPNTGTIVSTSYRPANYAPSIGSPADFFPAPAPAPPYPASLAALAGINPNGVWSLYVVDDDPTVVGTVGAGWRLNISTSDPLTDLAVGLAGPAAPVALGSNLVFVASVTNRGPAAGLIRFTNGLPPGVSLVSALPSQGSCLLTNGGVTCALGPLAPAAAASIVLTYQPQSIGTVSNSVDVRPAAGEVDLALGNNQASASALVRLATDVGVLSSTVTNLVLLSNDVFYTLIVTNRGPNPASAVALTDTLPSGATFISSSSTRGSCALNGTKVDCAIGALAAAQSAIVTLRVHPNSVGNYTNVSEVGLAEIDTGFANNRATNVTSVVVIADLAVSLTATPNPVAVSNQVAFVATVTNRGPSVADALILTNRLPAGAIFISGTFDGGACTESGGIISCQAGSLAAGSGSVFTIVVRPGLLGTLSNAVGVSSLALDEFPANNVAGAVLSVEQAPFVSVAPANLVVTNGGVALFTVTAGGNAPLQYQWQHNGADIPGATNALLTLSNVTYAARGNYAVRVVNRVGAVTSGPAGLTVLVPPTISNLPDLVLNEDESSAPQQFDVQDTDGPPEQLTILIESSSPTLLPATNVVVSGPSTSRTLRVTPATNQTGTATITVTVRDTNQLTASDTFTVQVRPMNDPPLLAAVADTQTDEDVSLVVNVSVSDVDNPAADLVLTATSSSEGIVSSGNLVVVGTGPERTLTVTPATNQFGPVVVTLFLTDTNQAVTSNSFTLVVHPVNDTPALGLLDSLTLGEDFGERIVPLAGIGAGATNETQLLTIAATSSDPTILPDPVVTYLSPADTGSLLLRSATNMSGNVTITVTVTDDAPTNRTLVRTFAVSVLGSNDVPAVSVIGDRAVDEDGQLAIGIQVIDADGAATNVLLQARSSDILLLPEAGLKFFGEGTNRVLQVSPATNAFGLLTVTVLASDLNAGTNLQSFTLTIHPVNDPPLIDRVGDGLLMENEAGRTIPLNGIGAGATNELEVVVVTAMSSDPAIVPHPAVNYVTPSTTGSLLLVPAPNQSGNVTITVTVDDGGSTNRVTVRQFTTRVLPSGLQPVIRTIHRVPGGADVVFPTSVGLVYVLEYTDSLPALEWLAFAPVTGTGQEMVVEDRAVAGPRFYRLRAALE